MLPRRFIQRRKVQEPLLASFRYWRDTFRAHNPDFDLLLFDDGDNASFIERIVRGTGPCTTRFQGKSTARRLGGGCSGAA
jgi:hypothetical protein